MSRSLNSLARLLWPVPAESLGLVIDTHRIDACRVVLKDDVRLLQEATSVATPFPIYNGIPPLDAVAQLAPLLAAVAPAAAGTALPVSILLPDPATSLSLLPLESLPATTAEREAVARWHAGKRWPAGTELVCQTRVLGQAGDRHLLLALTAARQWFDVLHQACRAADVMPCVWQPVMICRFNALADSSLAGSGALLSIDDSAWSLLLWDERGCPVYARSRWRKTGDGAGMEAIALEVERAIRAYVHGGTGRSVAGIHVAGDESAISQLLTLLAPHAEEGSVRRAVFPALADNQGGQVLVSAAATAAMMGLEAGACG